MSYKLAIIYTGETRTIDKVYPYFIKNCLHTENHHVFGVLQTDESDRYSVLLKEKFGNNLMNLDFFNKNDSTYFHLKNYLLKNMNLDYSWEKYLGFNSGSMIEYYQVFLAYSSIIKKERLENFKYDYIIRIRCDCVITKQLTFDWINYSKHDIQIIFNDIKSHHGFDNIVNKDVVDIFMNGLFDKDKLYLNDGIERKSYISSIMYNNIFLVDDEVSFINNFYDYFKNGKYLLTLRENVVYLINRKYFYPISTLGVAYGLTKYDDANNYWFNSESQLKSVCNSNEIDVFDSYTKNECGSLYSYDKNNYFDENGDLMKLADVFFFLMRN